MTRSEKIALNEAFGIPEPEKKRQFIAEYEQLAKKQKRKSISPLFIKIASMAAACAVVCGVWFNIRKNTDIHPGNNDHGNISVVVTDTEEDNTPDNNDSYAAVTTVSDTTGSTDKTSKTTAKTAIKTTAITTASATRKAGGTSDVSGTQKSDSSNESSPAVTSDTAASKPQENKNSKTNTTTAQQHNMTTTVQDKENPEPPQPIVPIDPVNVVSGEDKTLTPDVVYNNGRPVSAEFLRGEKTGGNNGVSPGGTDGVSHAPVVDNYLELITNQSDHVIRGTVDDVIYTSRDGIAYTQLDITVSEIIKSDGSVVQGDRISVRFLGGYISADEYARSHEIDGDFPDDWTVYENSMNRYEPESGREYILFINSGGYNIPRGGFSLIHETDNSIMTMDGDDLATLDHSQSCNISDLRNMAQ